MSRSLLRRCEPAAGGDELPNYWNPQRADPDIIIPTTGTSVNPVFGVGAWGAYVQIVAATAADLVLTQVNFFKNTTASCVFWLEIATGAAGAEVPLCYVGDQTLISGAGASPLLTLAKRVGPFKVPAGTRISARGWTTAGNTDGSVILSFIPPSPSATWVTPWPNTYIGGGRVTAPHRRDPVVPNWVATVATSPLWTQIVAAAPNDMLLDAVEWDMGNVGGGFGNIMEIGVGAAGAEVVFARAAWPGIVIAAWIFGYITLGRKVQVLAGERVAARMVKAAGVSRECAFYWEDYV
jgi:hypothetical protein